MELSAWKKTNDIFTLFIKLWLLSENKPLEQKETMDSMKCVTYPDKSNPVVAELCIERILHGFDFKALVLGFSTWKVW